MKLDDINLTTMWLEQDKINKEVCGNLVDTLILKDQELGKVKARLDNKKNGNTKDGSLSLHIYNQTLAGTIRLIAKKQNKTTQKLVNEILEEYINKHIEVK